MAERSNSRMGVGTLLLLGGGVFAAAFGWLRTFNSDQLGQSQVAEMFDAGGQLRPAVEIARTLAASKLITVEMETHVTSSAEDPLWRGTARATIFAPVKLSYGVDLEHADAKSLDMWAGARWLFVTVPKPKLIAVEPDLQRMEERIEVTGTRTRSRAGDTQRQLATKRLEEEARRLALTPEQQLEVEEMSKRQIEKLLAGLVASRYEIKVTFSNE